MKKNLFLSAGCLSAFLFLLINGCKKDRDEEPRSFSEEFVIVSRLGERGWYFANESLPGTMDQPGKWMQGAYDKDKVAGWPAYSYQKNMDEYIRIPDTYLANAVLNTWLITPVLHIRNGARISFYVRSLTYGNPGGVALPRLQLLLNETDQSVTVGRDTSSKGMFTRTLMDINPTYGPDLPDRWTRYETTISGIGGDGIKTRLALRALGPSPLLGLGIDLFEFHNP